MFVYYFEHDQKKKKKQAELTYKSGYRFPQFHQFRSYFDSIKAKTWIVSSQFSSESDLISIHVEANKAETGGNHTSFYTTIKTREKIKFNFVLTLWDDVSFRFRYCWIQKIYLNILFSIHNLISDQQWNRSSTLCLSLSLSSLYSWFSATARHSRSLENFLSNG